MYTQLILSAAYCDQISKQPIYIILTTKNHRFCNHMVYVIKDIWSQIDRNMLFYSCPIWM